MKTNGKANNNIGIKKRERYDDDKITSMTKDIQVFFLFNSC